MIDNYFSAEAPIIDRVKQETGLQRTIAASDLADVEKKSQTTPAFCVYYDRDLMPSGEGASAARGAARIVRQVWVVVVVVRNVRGSGGEASREDAGPIISKVIRALSGFKPTAQHGELLLVGGARAIYRTGGLIMFPVAFQTQISVGA